MLRALTLLFFCQLAGEAIVRAAGLAFPGPVLGMALLIAGLFAVGRAGADLDGVADGILRNLSLLFVPAAVGVMQQAGLIARQLARDLGRARRLDAADARSSPC